MNVYEVVHTERCEGLGEKIRKDFTPGVWGSHQRVLRCGCPRALLATKV